MLVDYDGRAVGTEAAPVGRDLAAHPSVRPLPGYRRVLHTHSHNQTVASRLFASAGEIRFEDYELIKALARACHP